MPKGDGTLKACLNALSVYIDNGVKNPMHNEKFKEKIHHKFGYDEKKDEPFLLKKSEIARYFGLVKYSFDNKESYITQDGIDFYNNEDKRINIIFNALKNKSFGKNNDASKSSDSSLNPPNLYLRSILELTSLSTKEFAYIIYKIENNNLGFHETLKNLLSQDDFTIPKTHSNKYNDPKFKPFFKELGIVYSYKNRDFIKINSYEQEILKLKIFSDSMEDLTNSIIHRTFPINNRDIIFASNNRKPDLLSNKFHAQFKTDAKLKMKVFEENNYECEIDINHKTFKKDNGDIYMEGHHLIPMKGQKDFPEINIDRTENIVCLCPNCHRMAHYGNKETRERILKLLYNKRYKSLSKAGINLNFNDLFTKYYD